MLVFLVVTPRGLVGSYQDGGSMFLGKVGMFLITSQHGVTAQKTNIDIFTAVRTSNTI
jgi:hypothetical protein